MAERFVQQLMWRWRSRLSPIVTSSEGQKMQRRVWQDIIEALRGESSVVKEFAQ